MSALDRLAKLAKEADERAAERARHLNGCRAPDGGVCPELLYHYDGAFGKPGTRLQMTGCACQCHGIPLLTGDGYLGSGNTVRCGGDTNTWGTTTWGSHT